MSQDSHISQPSIDKNPLIVIKGDMNENNWSNPSILNQIPIMEFKVINLLKPSHDLGKK